MYNAFRRAAPLLLAAAAFGLTRPVAAQAPAPLPPSFGPTDDAPLSHVVPPRRPPVVAVQAAPLPQTIAVAPNPPPLDLLTPPALPTTWTNPPAKPAPIPTPMAGRPAPAAYPASMTPPTRSPYAPTPPGPVAHPATPAVAAAKPIAAPAAPPKTWPTAFQTRDESRAYATTALVTFEKPVQPVKPAVAVQPAVAVRPAAAATNLRGRVLALCGPDALEVWVADQPDKTTVVTVRVRDAAAQQKVMGKIYKLPEMDKTTTRLEMVVRP